MANNVNAISLLFLEANWIILSHHFLEIMFLNYFLFLEYLLTDFFFIDRIQIPDLETKVAFTVRAGNYMLWNSLLCVRRTYSFLCLTSVHPHTSTSINTTPGLHIDYRLKPHLITTIVCTTQGVPKVWTSGQKAYLGFSLSTPPFDHLLSHTPEKEDKGAYGLVREETIAHWPRLPIQSEKLLEKHTVS